MRKKILSVLGIAVILSGIFFWGSMRSGKDTSVRENVDVPDPEQRIENNQIDTAVLYADGQHWNDMVNWLEQSAVLGLKTEGKNVEEEPELSEYEIIYLDESIAKDAGEDLVKDLMDYVYAGGSVFVSNHLCNYFPKEFLGISEVKKIDEFPGELQFPECGKNMGDLQQVLKDFSMLYQDYMKFDLLSEQDYGWGVEVAEAKSLAEWNGITLYAMNDYGKGKVFLVNPLLPNDYSPGSFTMESSESVAAFSNTTASFNQLLLSEFASYVAKEKQGYALERVYGYFGTPSMSWQLHYEELTGIANGSLQLFSELCEDYRQIPSFTLVRNSYTWFLRAESVTHLLNSSDNGYEFEMDFYESAYSSGTHVASGDQWLTLCETKEGGSYFPDYPELRLRAYPAVMDYDEDGVSDIISGSEDGKIYYYSGTEFSDGRLKTAEAENLLDENGEPIRISGYSAPQAADLDGDGNLDLVCGYDDGNIWWFRGNGTLTFENQGILLESDVPGQALPAIGDFNADGIADLAAGSDQGVLMLYYGTLNENKEIVYSHRNSRNLSLLCANAGLGKWLAPAIADWNGDGLADFVIGTFDGYLALLLQDRSGEYRFDGYVTIDEMNYKGNSNVKFGNYAVPAFADLNADGKQDLICGSQEYGMAYPIDSEYFMYEEELAEQIQYAKDHHYYMGMHFYTNAYASQERELYELEAHKKAMEQYGLSTDQIGVNQHTWNTSSIKGSQTMSSVYQSGLLWESGYSAPASEKQEPFMEAENVVSLPFYLVEDGQWTTLVQSNSVLLYGDDDWLDISARYNVPICVYFHCDHIYKSDEEAKAKLQAVAEFQKKYGYNFNLENQLMLASAAAIHQQVETEVTDAEGILIRPVSSPSDDALYNADVERSLGVRIEFSDAFDAEKFETDADIWYRDGNALIVGLNREISVFRSKKQQTDTHLTKINMAAEILSEERGAVVRFLDEGMMQAVVSGQAFTDSEDWDVQEEDGNTIFTKYGSKEDLHIIFREE
ncbi:MAG: FG-GAP repeat domain-containing protein [Lachnospiraceae bacterium]